MKTVTVTDAGISDRIRIGKRRFRVGEPMHDVPDAVVKELQELKGVVVQVQEQPKTTTTETPKARRK